MEIEREGIPPCRGCQSRDSLELFHGVFSGRWWVECEDCIRIGEMGESAEDAVVVWAADHGVQQLCPVCSAVLGVEDDACPVCGHAIRARLSAPPDLAE